NELTATHGTGDHYRSSGAFFDVHNPITLGDSLTDHNANGWWKVALTASSVAKGSIDLVLTVDFDENAYKTAHANFDPPDIRDSIEYRVRKGEPNIDNVEEDCGTRAVVAIADLASGTRGVTCSTDPLVNVQSHNARAIVHRGKFLHTLADGTDPRVGDANGTEDRTGLRIDNVYPFAIKNITTVGDYRLVPVEGANGVLTGHCTTHALGGTDANYVLHGISGSPGILRYQCSYNLGPQGKQGLPGPLGHEGPKGDPGLPAPPCP
ncbi:MAG: collagen-like protein, partial [Pseudomonadota bacterium]|nr:collagen-like protein [Pseudomonadota bacterium]